MAFSFQNGLRLCIGARLCAAVRKPVLPQHIHIPARSDAVGSPIAVSYALDADALAKSLMPESFLPYLGVDPVSAVRAENGWLLFTLSNALYSAAVDMIRSELPAPAHDCSSLALNRMMALAKKGGTGCPNDPAVERAFLLTLLLTDDARPAAIDRAESALLSMLHHLPPRERDIGIGQLADAAGRILYQVRS